jgi:hypothetical protein
MSRAPTEKEETIQGLFSYRIRTNTPCHFVYILLARSHKGSPGWRNKHHLFVEKLKSHILRGVDTYRRSVVSVVLYHRRNRRDFHDSGGDGDDNSC